MVPVSINYLTLGLLVGGSALLILDTVSYYRKRKTQLSFSTLAKQWGFLLAILALYGLIQALLSRSLPSTIELYRNFSNKVLVQHGNGHNFTIPLLVIVLVVTYYFAGLIDYSVHRLFSHSKMFFWTHEYHHVPRVVALGMPGIAVRPFSILTTVPTVALSLVFYTALFNIFKLPASYFGAVSIIFYFHIMVLITSHSFFLRQSSFMHKIMKKFGITTPREHVLHHAARLNGNFANLTTVWDRVFSTYIDPKNYDLHELELGTRHPQDFLGAITLDKIHISPRIQKFFEADEFFNTEWKKK